QYLADNFSRKHFFLILSCCFIYHKKICTRYLIWSLMIGASLYWNFQREHDRVLQLAEVEARANLKKDRAFRIWGSNIGGLYVKVNPEIQPSPYMQHIPERDVVTPSGQQLTLYSPAIILRLLMDAQEKLYGIKARITGKKFLNPDNAPDEWEQQGLEFIEQTREDYSNITKLNGEPVLRYMKPMLMQEVCLKCHAWTKIKVGDIRGATDVAIPLAPFYAIEEKSRQTLLVSHSTIWLLGVGFLSLFSYRKKAYLNELYLQQQALHQVNQSLQHQVDKRNEAEQQLHLTSTVFEHTSEAIIITDADCLIIDCNQAYSDITGYSLAEIKGKNPSFASSGRHNKAFFKAMWQSINQSGRWSGEVWDKRKNGEVYPKWLSINEVINAQGDISHYIGVFNDITDVKETENKLETLAFKDSLTNLPNRQLFYDRLEIELKRARRQENIKLALFFIDLDQFKQVNDTLGHQIGDELLQRVAQRLLTCVREKDTVARLGGGEFTIILTDIYSSTIAGTIAQKIINTITVPINLHGQEYFLGSSIGISLYPEDSTNKEILIRNADAAMYHAKENGRGNFQFFSEDINLRNQNRRQLEESLRRALKNDEFELYYQPQIDTLTDKIVGAEALIRWNDPQKGIISPLDFIPVAEENRMIIAIGEWVFNQSCKHLHECLAHGKQPVPVAINLSAVQFSDEGLIDMIKSVLEREKISSQWIELEITESAIMENADKAVKILEKLTGLGIRISIDDFGTGYSSMAYLKKFTVNKLKIDREFIKDLPLDKDDVALTSAMIMLAKNLELDVLAEGVETKEQVDFLIQQGCNLVQGYYYSKPLPEAEFMSYVMSKSAS
ncbi:MAG: EAL domain-containing protein, partial [gamma proteobacterium symbiont of Bathyaustriella thionipta]|nr:EAL domain-containing protein [gamma proteobacterium symbiont of Bathyaustriella thionipta]MCU7951440.1 EAL domain-containing protein [gamma proteobacterium symbiont of Bathyaustriella thionipta]MCU7951845.1 EAL domain-containing protein [gamma proteobacterium symbiont of Bathyaustriella thionipta]MCU7958001.1 EAL domain-containing protein [gamma proteobacterium symbiont of Bathyaustriella thionipta]MCU7966542.1 EAL domain-containing protein [gamma proteobacterium symbiont of Bathyaustriella